MKFAMPKTRAGWWTLAATVVTAIAAVAAEGTGYTRALVTIAEAIGLN